MTNPFEFIDARLSNIENLLIDLTLNPKVNLDETQPNKNWLNLEQLCNYLPNKPVKATVYGWVHNNIIPYHKGAKNLRFSKSEIDEWLKAGKRKTKAEVNSEAHTYLKKKGTENE